MIRAVIFDLDDTLIPEIDYVMSGYSAVSKQIASELTLDELTIYNDLIELFNQNRKNVFDRFLLKYNRFTTDLVKKMIHIYRNHEPEITLSIETFGLLNKLKKNKYKLGIITDGELSVQTKKIKALNIEKLFDCIICTDVYGKEYCKPNPRSFLDMTRRLKIKPQEVIYVGDNPTKDFFISSLLPIVTVQLINSSSLYKNELYLDNIKPHHIISNIANIFNMIEKINEGGI